MSECTGCNSEPCICGELPECPNYVAHPQSVWFEEHWRPIIEELKAEIERLKKENEVLRHGQTVRKGDWE